MNVNARIHGALTALLMLFAVGQVHAAQLVLIPTAATQNVVDGDIVSFDIFMDFTGEPTLGGGFNIHFDPTALRFVSFFRDESIGDPGFSRDPDILTGILESWSVASFDGLPETAVLGNVVFEVLPTMGQSTIVETSGTNSICGCWISSVDFVTLIPVDYGTATVSRIPLPATVWFFLGALGTLFGLGRVRSRST